MAKVETGMEAMVDMFIFETNTMLDQLDEILIRTEQANTFTTEDINEIFRIMHTVKGSSAMMGFENLQQLAHKGEDMFFIIRENTEVIKDAGYVYDLVFRMSDLIKAEIEKIQGNEDYTPTDFSDIIADLENGAKALSRGEAPVAGPKPVVSEEPVETVAPAEAPVSPDEGNISVRIFFQSGCKMENLRAFLIVNRIREECELVSFDPSDVESNPDSANVIVDNGFLITFKSEHKDTVLKIIEEAVNVESYEVLSAPVPDVKKEETVSRPIPEEASASEEKQPKIEATPASQPQPKAPTPAPSSDTAANAISNISGGAKQSLISVNLTKLDHLHDIVGEIITTESMVISNPEIEGLKLESFAKAARELRKLTDELQDTVMSIRMVPLTGVFHKMNRIVRDMKVKLDKDVELVIEGDTTEVDKSIVDNLNDPLMHLVRNCMDHGIEKTAEQRIQAGKPAKGTIRLAAMNSSSEVIITISDDGAGIDPERILKKAEKNGLLTKPVTEYTVNEIQNMILLPGFSTNEEVTEFSGRGVGMDVVKKNIEKIGGTLTLESVVGKGTTFTIKIPLTLAIIEGMEIVVGDTTFTIPISSIRESFKATNSQIIHDTRQGEMIMIRGTCYPIMRLHQKFEIETEITDFEQGILILVETENKSMCLFTDKLIGEQQVVVKPFPPYLGQYNLKKHGLSGCTIKGDGSISLIIDINSLITA